jgi:flagellar hook assembly protein FlgD
MLLGNSPNPVKPFTRILFALPDGAADAARLRVFDASGRVVRSFDRGFSSGLNQVMWDGTDAHGSPVGAGVYFYRLDVGTLAFTRKMVLVR